VEFGYNTLGYARYLGRAVQVDPMKPTLKAPGSKRLKLEHEKLLSNVGFNFNLRRYNVVPLNSIRNHPPPELLEESHCAAVCEVGRCRLTPG